MEDKVKGILRILKPALVFNSLNRTVQFVPLLSPLSLIVRLYSAANVMEDVQFESVAFYRTWRVIAGYEEAKKLNLHPV